VKYFGQKNDFFSAQAHVHEQKKPLIKNGPKSGRLEMILASKGISSPVSAIRKHNLCIGIERRGVGRGACADDPMTGTFCISICVDFKKPI
jgi:hypothetical protein